MDNIYVRFGGQLSRQSYRYIDNLISFNKQKDLRSSFLTFNPKNSQLLKPQNLLQLLLTSICFSPEIKVTKLYDKSDAFGFHIANFPFMSSNIPSAPAYGVYASQFIRYARCCSNYSDFYYATGPY